MGDLTYPLKRALGRRSDWWRNAEQWLDRAIRERFDLHPFLEHEERRAVKRADLVALATERAALMPDDGLRWPILDGIEPQERFPIHCYTPDDARTVFLERFRELHRGAV